MSTKQATSQSSNKGRGKVKTKPTKDTSKLKKLEMPEPEELTSMAKAEMFEKVNNIIDSLKDELSDHSGTDVSDIQRQLDEMSTLLEQKTTGRAIDIVELTVFDMSKHVNMVGNVSMADFETNEDDETSEYNDNNVNCVFLGIANTDENVDSDDIVFSLLVNEDDEWTVHNVPTNNVNWLYVFPDKGNAEITVNWEDEKE